MDEKLWWTNQMSRFKILFLILSVAGFVFYFTKTPVSIPLFLDTTDSPVHRYPLAGFRQLIETCYYDLKSIDSLPQCLLHMKVHKNKHCRQQYDNFVSVYNVRVKYTQIVVSDTFRSKVAGWLNNDNALIEATKNQSLIFIDNMHSLESVVFNPVRANRPGVKSSGTLAYIKQLLNKTKTDCDFCSYAKYTAADSFGRLTSKHSVVVSNTFKIEKYHGMLLFLKHDLLDITLEQFMDGMYLALTWFEYTNKHLPSHAYRFMYWDILPKASASQVHPHVHLTLGDYSYYSKWNKIHQAALEFQKKNPDSNYFEFVLRIHDSLGLLIRFGSAYLVAYLTPQKDYEVWILSDRPCKDFFRLVYLAYKAYMDAIQQYSLSMGFVFPKMHSNKDELPMMARILSRGPADNTRSDISSFDLFGTPNVNTDPFKFITNFKRFVEENGRQSFSSENWKLDFL